MSASKSRGLELALEMRMRKSWVAIGEEPTFSNDAFKTLTWTLLQAERHLELHWFAMRSSNAPPGNTCAPIPRWPRHRRAAHEATAPVSVGFRRGR